MDSSAVQTRDSPLEMRSITAPEAEQTGTGTEPSPGGGHVFSALPGAVSQQLQRKLALRHAMSLARDTCWGSGLGAGLWLWQGSGGLLCSPDIPRRWH